MYKTLYIFVIVSIFISCSKNTRINSRSINLNTKVDSISYGMGVNLGSSYKRQEFDINPELFFNGFMDSYKEEASQLSEDETRQMLRDYYMEVRMNKSEQQKILSEKNNEKSNQFLNKNKTKKDVTELPSGLQYKIIRSGSGESPDVNGSVKVHYIGKRLDGTVFDSSTEKDEPVEFSLRSLIKGWSEGLQLMKVGAKWELYIPPELGYGRRGSGGKIGPNECLIFEVELIDIISN
ncbi:MAG: hypothetical protein CMG69_02010 [Candidatus Marinimicrobia bacterium]|nr:hypothetical protein [Candidatus Neomarinimicrobiota bacterium]